MTNIIEFIRMLDQVVPGFASGETLLYSPELKFYSNKVKMDTNLNTNIWWSALSGRFFRMDQRTDDGICHGCADGTEASGEGKLRK